MTSKFMETIEIYEKTKDALETSRERERERKRERKGENHDD